MEKGTGFDIELFKKRYLGLKKAPLEAWIAEFLKRNEQFQTDCLGVNAFRATKNALGEKALPESHFPSEAFWRIVLQQKYGVGLLNWEPEKQSNGLKLAVFLPPPVRGIRIMASAPDRPADEVVEKKAQRYGGPHKKSFLNLIDQRLEIIGEMRGCKRKTSTNGGTFVERDPCHFVMDDLLGCESDDSGLYDVPDTLLLTIDLRKPRKKIDELVDKFLKIHLFPPEKRRVPNKWMYYLMVYDLRHINPDGKRMTFGQIQKYIVRIEKQDTGMQDENDASRYYKRCLKLIKGGYRRYL